MAFATFARGLALQNQGRHDEAVLAFQAALTEAPGFAAALFHLGVSLFEIGHYADAARAYQAAGDAAPGMFEAHNNRGMALQKLERYQAAIESYDRGIAINPHFAPLYNGRGNCLVLQDRTSDALADFDHAISIDPAFADAVNNRAILLHRSNRLEDAAMGYDQAIALAAVQGFDFAGARFNRSLLRLLAGDFENGWAEYDYRLHLDGYQRVARDVRQWDGQPFDGTLFVRAEQGYGDTFQFVRYLPLARERCTRLVFECQHGLAPLLEASDLCDQIVERPSSGALLPAPDDATVVYIQSLPGVFRTRPLTIPARVPYLRAPDDRLALWAARIESLEPRGLGRLRVGIVWRGNQTEPVSRLRSCDLSDFARLATPSIAFFSLQRGFRQDCRISRINRIIPDHPVNPVYPVQERITNENDPLIAEGDQSRRTFNFQLHPISDDFSDFADTAAAIEQMDLVITIDTSVAHLAGALDKPVWTLLPWCPDWRWMMDRTDCPWYPTMRLFRQPGLGQWEPVFEDVKVALAQVRGTSIQC